MMNWSNPLFIISVVTGAVLLLAALFSSIWPAKKINDLYGYRTVRSKKGPDQWAFAQSYSNRLMFIVALLNALLGIIGLFVTLTPVLSVVISLLFMIISVVWLIRRTEGALKRKFGE